jgi:hypothetical protein
MEKYAKFYEETLYPLQDGVLKTLAKAFATLSERIPFLTGGTALSRCYFEHRYSDDLDFFMSSEPRYAAITELAFSALEAEGFRIEPGSLIRSDAFTRLSVSRKGATLKIDLINDVAAHFGPFVGCDFYPKVDGLQNILSNKITALYRLEPKDVADLREIALHYDFSWIDIMTEADAKEAGIDAPTVAEIIETVPHELFDAIRWRTQPDRTAFFEDLTVMARDAIEGRKNSLAQGSASTGST